MGREHKHSAEVQPDPLESKQNKGHAVTGRGRPEHRVSDKRRKGYFLRLQRTKELPEESHFGLAEILLLNGSRTLETQRQ